MDDLPAELIVEISEAIFERNCYSKKGRFGACDGCELCASGVVKTLLPFALTSRRLARLIRPRMRRHVVLYLERSASRLAECVARDPTWGQSVHGLYATREAGAFCPVCGLHQMPSTKGPIVTANTFAKIASSCSNLKHLSVCDSPFADLRRRDFRFLETVGAVRNATALAVWSPSTVNEVKMFSARAFAQLVLSMPNLRDLHVSGLEGGPTALKGLANPACQIERLVVGDLDNVHANVFSWLLDDLSTFPKLTIDGSFTLRNQYRAAESGDDACGWLRCLSPYFPRVRSLTLRGMLSAALDHLCCGGLTTPGSVAWPAIDCLSFESSRVEPSHILNFTGSPVRIRIYDIEEQMKNYAWTFASPRADKKVFHRLNRVSLLLVTKTPVNDFVGQIRVTEFEPPDSGPFPPPLPLQIMLVLAMSRTKRRTDLDVTDGQTRIALSFIEDGNIRKAKPFEMAADNE